MKKALLLFVFLFFLTAVPRISPALGQTSQATCDLCGYCQGKEQPQDWVSCKNCLYPGIASNDATTNDTLKIEFNSEANSNTPITPKPGNYYTTIGCFSTDLSSFTETGAAGSVTQRLLTIIFSIGGGIAFIYLLYGSFLIMTSRSDPERLNHGKKTIYGALLGIIFTLSAVFIVNTIGSSLLKIPGFEEATP